MKAYLEDLIRQSDNPLQRRDLVREYLQARILGSLQRVGAMVPLAFHGGTACASFTHCQDIQRIWISLWRVRQNFTI